MKATENCALWKCLNEKARSRSPGQVKGGNAQGGLAAYAGRSHRRRSGHVLICFDGAAQRLTECQGLTRSRECATAPRHSPSNSDDRSAVAHHGCLRDLLRCRPGLIPALVAFHRLTGGSPPQSVCCVSFHAAASNSNGAAQCWQPGYRRLPFSGFATLPAPAFACRAYPAPTEAEARERGFPFTLNLRRTVFRCQFGRIGGPRGI